MNARMGDFLATPPATWDVEMSEIPTDYPDFRRHLKDNDPEFSNNYSGSKLQILTRAYILLTRMWPMITSCEKPDHGETLWHAAIASRRFRVHGRDYYVWKNNHWANVDVYSVEAYGEMADTYAIVGGFLTLYMDQDHADMMTIEGTMHACLEETGVDAFVRYKL